jgi:hypothetical protein
MPGLIITDEERASRVAALVRELGQYEQRAAGTLDDVDREKWLGRADQVRAQLGLLGSEGVAPQRRATKRLVDKEQVR